MVARRNRTIKGFFAVQLLLIMSLAAGDKDIPREINASELPFVARVDFKLGDTLLVKSQKSVVLLKTQKGGHPPEHLKEYAKTHMVISYRFLVNGKEGKNVEWAQINIPEIDNTVVVKSEGDVDGFINKPYKKFVIREGGAEISFVKDRGTMAVIFDVKKYAVIKGVRPNLDLKSIKW